jgi:hypothetical protein
VNALKQTMEVLKTRWPAKKPLIETELRKLVTEIGLDRIIRERLARARSGRSPARISAMNWSNINTCASCSLGSETLCQGKSLSLGRP